jgi:hypothetical protein
MRIEGNSRTLFRGWRFEIRGSNKRHRPRVGGSKFEFGDEGEVQRDVRTAKMNVACSESNRFGNRIDKDGGEYRLGFVCAVRF